MLVQKLARGLSYDNTAHVYVGDMPFEILTKIDRTISHQIAKYWKTPSATPYALESVSPVRNLASSSETVRGCSRRKAGVKKTDFRYEITAGVDTQPNNSWVGVDSNVFTLIHESTSIEPGHKQSIFHTAQPSP